TREELDRLRAGVAKTLAQSAAAAPATSAAAAPASAPEQSSAAASTPEATAEVRLDAQPDASTEAQPDAKAQAKPGAGADAQKQEAKPPVKVVVVIDSQPRGAAVFVGGTRKGQTPMILDLMTGSEEVPIRVEKPGYRPQLQTVRPEEDTKLSLQLSRI